jgi:hypothetical protein
LKIADEHFFSRCVICNTKLQDLNAEYARKLPDYPWDIEKKEGLEKLKFFYCDTCNKLFWWGPKSYFTIEDLKKMIAIDGIEEKKEDVLEFEVPQMINESEISISHNLQFSSAYFSIQEKEPKFTNFTHNFIGTLDYIFYSKNSKLECVNVLDLPTDLDAPLPDASWPSDHLPLKAEFS